MIYYIFKWKYPKIRPLSNLISLFYVKIRVVSTLPLTLAEEASTKKPLACIADFASKVVGALS